MAGKRESSTTQPKRGAATNDKSVWQMIMAASKRVRVARVMVTTIRVVGGKEGKSIKAMARATRVGGEQTTIATKREMATKTRLRGAVGAMANHCVPHDNDPRP